MSAGAFEELGPDRQDAGAIAGSAGKASAAAVRDAPASLLNRDFVLLWQGQLVSQVGSQAFAIAAMYWLKEATGSASLMGLLMTLSMLPGVVLGPLGGVLADRFSRRGLIIATDALSGLAILALTAVFAGPPGLERAALAALLAAALAVGILQAFFRPAIIAALPDLVPASRLAAANSFYQLSAQVATVLGWGLGGVCFSLFGAPALFLFDALSFLFSAGSESFIRIPQRTPDREMGVAAALRAIRRDLAVGLAYVWERRGMRQLIVVVALINFFITPVIVLMPFYVEQVLRRGAAWYGLLFAAYSAGSVAGFVAAGTLRIAPSRRGAVVQAVLTAGSATFLVLGFVTVPALALVLMAVSGAMFGMFNILFMTLFQRSTPSELRGRVIGLVLTMAMGAAPIGMALGGVLGDLTGKNVPLVYGLSGTVMAAVALLLGNRVELRRYLAWDGEGSA